MKRSEAIYKISQKLQKSIHMMKSQKQLDNPKMLCDNLALRVLLEIESFGMKAPETFIPADKLDNRLYPDNDWMKEAGISGIVSYEWEKEDE